MKILQHDIKTLFSLNVIGFSFCLASLRSQDSHRLMHYMDHPSHIDPLLIMICVSYGIFIFSKVCMHIIFSYLNAFDHVWCFVKLLASGVSDSKGLGCWRGDLHWSRLILPCINQGKGVTNIMTSRRQRKSSTLVDGDDTNPEMACSDPSGALCIEDCLYDGEHKAKDMIRCCQCVAWVHIDCINKTEEYVPGV